MRKIWEYIVYWWTETPSTNLQRVVLTDASNGAINGQSYTAKGYTKTQTRYCIDYLYDEGHINTKFMYFYNPLGPWPFT